jgi:hypothetical protein
MALDPVTRGDYATIEFVIDEPDPFVAGDRRPRDISEDTLRFSAKFYFSDGEAVITKTSLPGGGITKTNAADGEAEVEILGSDTAPLPFESLIRAPLICDIEGTPSGSPPRTYTTTFELWVVPDVST